jgi:hypothetical protein
MERRGVQVVYANEPTGGTESGRLRTRRYGQVEAEIYRTTLMEMSMGGQVEHAVNRWNHGHPPYPHVAVLDESAPRQERGRFGPARPKKKLAPHPDTRRFDAAGEIHRLRREEHLKTPDIVAALAAEPDRYPIGKRWTRQPRERPDRQPEVDRLHGLQPESRPHRPGRRVPAETDLGVDLVAADHTRTRHQLRRAEGRPAGHGGAQGRSGGYVSLQGLRAAARRLGLTVTPVRSGSTHTVYLVGEQQVVLPNPVPDALVQQIVDAARAAS